MKPRLAHILFSALLMVGVLSSAMNGYATPPQQHAERGIILTVDHAANSFTIVSKKDEIGRMFFWNEHTRFRQKSSQPDAGWISRLFSLGEKTTAEALQPGRSVRFYYRREFGRPVVHGVTVLAAINSGCGCCPRSTSMTTLTERLPL